MPKRVDAAFYVPPLRRGSGGHRTVLRYAGALAESGLDVCCVVEAAAGDVRASAEELWPTGGTRFLVGFDAPVSARVAYATAWHTAPAVLGAPGLEQRAYLVQDLEGWFHPVGEHALAGETSLDLRLKHVALGRWLAHHLIVWHGSRPHVVDLGADTATYHPGGARSPGRPRVCVLFQPHKPRRLASVLLDVVGRVSRDCPGVLIYLFGSDEPPALDVPHVFLGMLSDTELADLYRECDVGVVTSMTNPSRVPFEMLSCGLPVVDVYRCTTLFDFDASATMLALPGADSLAAAVVGSLQDDQRRQQMARSAAPFMRNRTLDDELRAFVAVHERLAEGQEAGTSKPPVSFPAEPVAAGADRAWAEAYIRRHRLLAGLPGAG